MTERKLVSKSHPYSLLPRLSYNFQLIPTYQILRAIKLEAMTTLTASASS